MCESNKKVGGLILPLTLLYFEWIKMYLAQCGINSFGKTEIANSDKTVDSFGGQIIKDIVLDKRLDKRVIHEMCGHSVGYENGVRNDLILSSGSVEIMFVQDAWWCIYMIEMLGVLIADDPWYDK